METIVSFSGAGAVVLVLLVIALDRDAAPAGRIDYLFVARVSTTASCSVALGTAPPREVITWCLVTQCPFGCGEGSGKHNRPAGVWPDRHPSTDWRGRQIPALNTVMLRSSNIGVVWWQVYWFSVGVKSSPAVFDNVSGFLF